MEVLPEQVGMIIIPRRNCLREASREKNSERIRSRKKIIENGNGVTEHLLQEMNSDFDAAPVNMEIKISLHFYSRL